MNIRYDIEAGFLLQNFFITIIITTIYNTHKNKGETFIIYKNYCWF